MQYDNTNHLRDLEIKFIIMHPYTFMHKSSMAKPTGTCKSRVLSVDVLQPVYTSMNMRFGKMLKFIQHKYRVYSSIRCNFYLKN